MSAQIKLCYLFSDSTCTSGEEEKDQNQETWQEVSRFECGFQLFCEVVKGDLNKKKHYLYGTLLRYQIMPGISKMLNSKRSLFAQKTECVKITTRLRGCSV